MRPARRTSAHEYDGSYEARYGWNRNSFQAIGICLVRPGSYEVRAAIKKKLPVQVTAIAIRTAGWTLDIGQVTAAVARFAPQVKVIDRR